VDSCGEPETICRLVPDLAGDLAAEDGVLVLEHEQFGVLGGVAVQQHRGDGQQSSSQLIQQRHRIMIPTLHCGG
jgi:hypothetical protein